MKKWAEWDIQIEKDPHKLESRTLAAPELLHKEGADKQLFVSERLLKQMPMHYNSFVCVQQSKVGIQSPFAHLVLGKFARRPKMIF